MEEIREMELEYAKLKKTKHKRKNIRIMELAISMAEEAQELELRNLRSLDMENRC